MYINGCMFLSFFPFT